MEIPIYPASRPLTLRDRDSLQELFRQLQPQVSELSFANLYLFRKAHGYRLSQLGGSLVIVGHGYGREPYFLPPLSGERGEAARLLLADGLALYGADERFVADHLDQSTYAVIEDRDNFDYLYRREELALLPGKRFHKKKNRISYFTARHSYSLEKFAPSVHLPGALALLAEWQRVHAPHQGSPLDLEIEATKEALELSEDLRLEGLVVLVADRVAAFALGEQLNCDTAVCHFEKADPFIEGGAQLINREFSSRLFTGCTYLNREQDLGEPGLRTAKSSYHPVGLVKKFRVTRK